MRTLLFGLAFAAGFATTTYAQNAVNIVAPGNGLEYPRSVGNPGPSRVWVTFSFNTFCGNLYHAEWFLDGQVRGSSDQIDENSVQYTDILDPGGHEFKVDTDCGTSSINFEVKSQ